MIIFFRDDVKFLAVYFLRHFHRPIDTTKQPNLVMRKDKVTVTQRNSMEKVVSEAKKVVVILIISFLLTLIIGYLNFMIYGF